MNFIHCWVFEGICTNQLKYANQEWWFSHLMADHPLFFQDEMDDQDDDAVVVVVLFLVPSFPYLHLHFPDLKTQKLWWTGLTEFRQHMCLEICSRICLSVVFFFNGIISCSFCYFVQIQRENPISQKLNSCLTDRPMDGPAHPKAVCISFAVTILLLPKKRSGRFWNWILKIATYSHQLKIATFFGYFASISLKASDYRFGLNITRGPHEIYGTPLLFLNYGDNFDIKEYGL